MSSSAVRRFTGQGLKPSRVPEAARLNAIAAMWPGTYVAGTVLGQSSTLTAVNDVQTITINYTPTGGSFYGVFSGTPIGPIAFNAAAAAVQALLDAAPNIGTGQTVVTGGPLPGTPIVITFSGTLMAGLYQPLMTVISNSLTGGTPGTLVISHTTPGQTAGGVWCPYDDTLSNGMEVARVLLANATVVNTYGQIQTGGGQWGEKSFTASVYFGG